MQGVLCANCHRIHTINKKQPIVQGAASHHRMAHNHITCSGSRPFINNEDQ